MLPLQALLHKLVSVLLPGSEGVLLKLKSHVDHQRILFFIFWGALKSSRDFWGVNIPVTLILEYSPGMLHHFATTTFVQFKLIFKKGHQWPCCFQLQSDLQHKLAEMESMHLFCLFIDVVDVRSLIWIRIYADTDQVTQLLEENQSFKLQSLTTMLFWEKWTLL